MKPIIHCLIIITLFMAHTVFARDVPADVKSAQELITDIQSGGYILYMRHGATKRKDKSRNKAMVDIGNCDTQRNLTPEGLREVQEIGKVMKSLNIPIGAVSSSPYCRTKDTAKAVFGDYKVDDKLSFSISKAHEESEMLGNYLHNIMLQSNDTKRNTVFVGHTANLKDGLGIWPKPEGVVVVFKKLPKGIVYKGMITPNDWLK